MKLLLAAIPTADLLRITPQNEDTENSNPGKITYVEKLEVSACTVSRANYDP